MELYSDLIICVLTFAAIRRNLSKGVVTAVTLASDHTGLTLALAAFSVTCPGERADRVTVTQQASVTAFRTVVVVLETGLKRRSADLHFLFSYQFSTPQPPHHQDKQTKLVLLDAGAADNLKINK